MPKNIFRRPGEPCMVWISGNWSMFLVTHWSITLPELFSFLLSCYMGGVGQRLFYLRTKDRLHYDIFSCPCTHTHTTPLALTLWDLLLHLHTDRMLRYDIFFCNCTILHAHTHTHLMLCHDVFSGTESTNGLFRQILAKWQLTDNMKKGWKTCRFNYLSSNYPNTSFVRRFLQVEVRNTGVRGTVLLRFSHLIVLVGMP